MYDLKNILNNKYIVWQRNNLISKNNDLLEV